MFSSHVVVTEHVPSESVLIFLSCMFFTKKETDGVFLLNAHVHKSTLIVRTKKMMLNSPSVKKLRATWNVI